MSVQTEFCEVKNSVAAVLDDGATDMRWGTPSGIHCPSSLPCILKYQCKLQVAQLAGIERRILEDAHCAGIGLENKLRVLF